MSVTASELIGPDPHPEIRIIRVFNTNDGVLNTKQFVIQNRETTLKKKYGGPQIYTVKIREENGDNHITPSSKVKVYCNCADFTYRRAYCLYKDKGLLMPEGFVLTPPKETNPTCHKKYCKHVSKALQYSIERNV